jgi:hypothetical protein
MAKATHIEFQNNTKAFFGVMDEDIELMTDSYNRKIDFASRVHRSIAKRRFTFRLDMLWYAHQVKRALVSSAAANLAAAKANQRAKDIVMGLTRETKKARQQQQGPGIGE